MNPRTREHLPKVAKAGDTTAHEEDDPKDLPYPAALAPPGSGVKLWRVDVPDLPGCYVTGPTLAEAVASTVGAVEAWLDQVRASGLAVPPASTMDAWARSPDYPGCFWFLVARPEPSSVVGSSARSRAAMVAAQLPGDEQVDHPDDAHPTRPAGGIS